MARSLNMKRFVGNTGWQMAQQIYSMLLSLIIGSISARFLGPSNYGLINYGASLISLFAHLTGLGLDEVIMNEMVSNKDKQGTFLGTALVMRLIASALGVVSMGVIVMVLEPDNKLLWVITVLQSFQLFGNLYYVFNYWFQIELKSKYVSIAYIIGLTVSGVWRVVLLITGASVEFFAFTGSLQGILVLIIVAFCFFRLSHVRLSFDFSVGKDLLKKGYHYIISGIAVIIYMQMDKVMIGKISGEEELGFYSAASNIANLWLFVPRAIINTARPLVLEGKNLDRAGDSGVFEGRLIKLLTGIMLLGAFVGLGFTVFGNLAVYILYGKAYMSAGPVLAILIWATVLSQFGSINGIWVVSEGYSPYLKYTVWIGAVTNLVLNSVFIPLFGILGAAIATFMAQFVVQFIAPHFVKPLNEYFAVYKKSVFELRNVKNYISLVFGFLKR